MDYTLCKNENCALKNQCKRFTTKSDSVRQSYLLDNTKRNNCEAFQHNGTNMPEIDCHKFNSEKVSCNGTCGGERASYSCCFLCPDNSKCKDTCDSFRYRNVGKRRRSSMSFMSPGNVGIGNLNAHYIAGHIELPIEPVAVALNLHSLSIDED